MKFTESNIELDLPEADSFRFQDLDSYKKLSSYSFKEADACWYDKDRNRLYLVELKDFTSANLAEAGNIKTRIFDLIKKSVDSLQMILSIQLKNNYGNKITDEMGFELSENCKIKFVMILNINDFQKEALNAIGDKFKVQFKAYETIFDLERPVIINRDKAAEVFSWVNIPAS